MIKSEVDDALAALWTLVREHEPIVIGSQSLHGTHPDVADTIQYSREVDVILPNKARMGNWLSDVVGDGTPFSVDRGYYIDHVQMVPGLPILAEGWSDRAVRLPFEYNGQPQGHVRYLSPEDMSISKLGAGRDKDISFVGKLIEQGYVQLEDLQALVALVPADYQDRVREGLSRVSPEVHLEIQSPPDPGST